MCVIFLLLIIVRRPTLRVFVIKGLYIMLNIIRVIHQILVIRVVGVMLFLIDDLATVIFAGGVQPALHTAGS